MNDSSASSHNLEQGDSGKTYLVHCTVARTINLPAPTSGVTYKFIVTDSTAASTINAESTQLYGVFTGDKGKLQNDRTSNMESATKNINKYDRAMGSIKQSRNKLKSKLAGYTARDLDEELLPIMYMHYKKIFRSVFDSNEALYDKIKKAEERVNYRVRGPYLINYL